jgi:hypothetical protein
MGTYLLCVGLVLGGTIWVQYLAAPRSLDKSAEQSRSGDA